ncbi:alcohol dehydrogenase [Pseudoalteromonas sp. NBT06-2]|uniref:iron-containing alcohol dehydrogenase n=1 Tax=Pseudoalteromonas sp. NBT06-2 TaxID=2025950 RepID=UPI000BA77EA6|nr:iron-containing alcohol dehydrogenase [Pseudoalteromonas sp. NBT06-2]PAJ73589.1 alcohol dehydrogenase [Pseudoalteromonas sp. NBT06-2]
MKLDHLKADWNYPTNIKQGIGRVTELPELCKNIEMKKPLLITDPYLAQQPMVSKILTHCREQGLNCDIFSKIVSNPTEQNIIDGVMAFNNSNHDGVIALGGGSAIDAAKSVALMAGQTLPLWSFEDKEDNWSRVNTSEMVSVIAVPTTSGTGSEVGRVAVITDVEAKIKRLIYHPNMLPKVVILDPELTLDLPAHLTAATGMDAFSHALEAYCAPSYHPMAQGIALEAIRLIKDNLLKATLNGQNLEARAHVMVASTMGATAFQRGLGGMHALAHSLGALYNCHHGLLNAILMPYVLKANRSEIEGRIRRLTRYIGLKDACFDSFIAWVINLRHELNMPHTLSDIDITVKDASLIGEMAFKDPCAGSNPIQFSKNQYTDIFMNALNGEI